MALSDWRKIERELEEWARGEGMSLDRNALGDIVADTYQDTMRGYINTLNLTSLARRLADTMTLRLVEPATKSRDPGQKP